MPLSREPYSTKYSSSFYMYSAKYSSKRKELSWGDRTFNNNLTSKNPFLEEGPNKACLHLEMSQSEGVQ
jgi:hypothetical protein